LCNAVTRVNLPAFLAQVEDLRGMETEEVPTLHRQLGEVEALAKVLGKKPTTLADRGEIPKTVGLSTPFRKFPASF
jgi:hypothetical protein